MKSYIRVQLYYSLFRKMKEIGMNHEMKFDTRGIQAYILWNIVNTAENVTETRIDPLNRFYSFSLYNIYYFALCSTRYRSLGRFPGQNISNF